MNEFERINYYTNLIKEQIDFKPEVAIVLGSGINELAETIEVAKYIDYKSLEGFPTCSALGHVGRFVFGYIDNVRVVIMQGRIHYYEGYDMSDVVLPLRVMHQLGANNVFFTNAAGSMREDFKPTELMIFEDCIAFLVPSPLRGKNIDEIGERFPDTTSMFNEEIINEALMISRENNIKLNKGVYVQAGGPQFESPAEMRAFKIWGGDAVGMSTACECVAALHMNMNICAISVLTNYESGLNITTEPLTHQQVQDMANLANKNLEVLLKQLIINCKSKNLLK